MTPINGAATRTDDIDLREFHAWLGRATAQQKTAAIYWLLRDQLGPRFEQEFGVYDPDDFLYAYIISPGQREAFRFLENPGLLEELERAALEPMVPLSEIHRELGLNVD